jgi:hypothetical protein
MLIKPLDLLRIPDSFSNSLAASIRVARAIRESPALCAAEGLTGFSDYGKDIFDDRVCANYITDRFGVQALEQYLKSLPKVGDLAPMIDEGGWRASPLSLMMALGNDIVPGSTAVYGAHLRAISNMIVRAFTVPGAKRRLCISCPVRHAKSTMCSIAAPLWAMANWPHLSVGLVSHSESIVAAWSRIVRNIILGRSERFGFGIADDSQAKQDWNTSLGGRLWIGSQGSGFIGKGASSLLVCDDIVRGTEAVSPGQLDSTWNWLLADALTRLEPGAVVLLVGTRYDEQDPIGRLMTGHDGVDTSQWEFLHLPAICETENDFLGRKVGDALWENVRPKSELLTMKAGMSQEAWELAFQCRSIQASGIGRCFSAFDPATHVRPTWFDPSLPIRLSVDLNVDAFSWVIGQMQEFIADRVRWILCNERLWTLNVLEECILRNQATETAVEVVGEILRSKYASRAVGKLKLIITGDASGSARKTSGQAGQQGEPMSDWDQIRNYFNRHTNTFRVSYDVRSSNPSVKSRIDRCNSLLRSADGRSLFSIDPSCKTLITDLKEVRWARDANGNPLPVQDKRDPLRSHASDALGYLVMAAGGAPQAYAMKESIR